jgi:dihydroflavonol-4-reductase
VKTLVTGAAGFIGSHVVRALVAAGHEVRALHLPGDDLRNLVGLDVERRPGDVTDAASLRPAMRGCEQVFHLAAVYALWTRDPGLMQRVNVGGTRRVLEVARDAGVRRVVYTSSIARFGGQGAGRRATEASRFALGPTGDVYARSKADAHEVALAAAHAGQDVVIVAPTGPIGPGDVGPTPTGRLIVAALNLPAVVVARSVSSFAHVADMAAGHLLAAARGRAGETYLLGAEDVALEDLARRTLAIAGLEKPVIVAPFALARLGARAALFAAAHVTHRAPLVTPAAVAIARLGLAADCSRAVRELGFSPRPLDEALRDALAWFAEHGYVRNPALRTQLLRRCRARGSTSPPLSVTAAV